MATMIDAYPHGQPLHTDPSRLRTGRQRDASRAVRDARERLASHSGTRPAFDYEILLEHMRNRQSSLLAVMVLISLLAFTASYWLDYRHALAWAAASLTALLGTAWLGQRFARIPETEVRLDPWRRRFMLAEGLIGLSFASLFFLPGIGGGETAIFAFGAAMTGVAINAMVASNLPRSVLIGTLPIAVAAAVQLARGQSLVDYSMSGFLALAEAFFAFLAYRLHDSALTMMEYRVEKDALIAELEQAKAISDDSRRRAEEANLAKSRFLATMSHELRTPLNAILGFSEIMMGEVFGPLGNDHYKEYAGDIHNSGRHLLDLINEILDLSRIEAGRYQLNEEAIFLADVAEECVHLMALKAKTKALTLITQVEPDLPKIWADERAIRQVILNLLSNATKFTQTNGEIRIRAGWTAGGGQYVSVQDNGPGIPDNEMETVMQAFGQGSLAIQTAEQGTGLGLPICQALMQMHGGTLDLKSVLRQGTTVTMTFPPARVLEIMPPIAGISEMPTTPQRRPMARAS